MGTLTYAAISGIVLILAIYYIVEKSIKRLKLNRKLRGLISSQGQYDFLLCDVRTQSEYERGHIPGAVSFPLNELNYLPVKICFLP
jgi:3-mercaptopyruvate sulfurtransferase SseA